MVHLFFWNRVIVHPPPLIARDLGAVFGLKREVLSFVNVTVKTLKMQLEYTKRFL